MTINEQAPRDLLCERLCQDVSVDRRPDGALTPRTQFRFPVGDGFPIHLSEAPADKLPEALFQLGQALTRIYDLRFLSHSNPAAHRRVAGTTPETES